MAEVERKAEALFGSDVTAVASSPPAAVAVEAPPPAELPAVAVAATKAQVVQAAPVAAIAQPAATKPAAEAAAAASSSPVVKVATHVLHKQALLLSTDTGKKRRRCHRFPIKLSGRIHGQCGGRKQAVGGCAAGHRCINCSTTARTVRHSSSSSNRTAIAASEAAARSHVLATTASAAPGPVRRSSGRSNCPTPASADAAAAACSTLPGSAAGSSGAVRRSSGCGRGAAFASASGDSDVLAGRGFASSASAIRHQHGPRFLGVFFPCPQLILVRVALLVS